MSDTVQVVVPGQRSEAAPPRTRAVPEAPAPGHGPAGGDLRLAWAAVAPRLVGAVHQLGALPNADLRTCTDPTIVGGRRPDDGRSVLAEVAFRSTQVGRYGRRRW